MFTIERPNNNGTTANAEVAFSYNNDINVNNDIHKIEGAGSVRDGSKAHKSEMAAINSNNNFYIDENAREGSNYSDAVLEATVVAFRKSVFTVERPNNNGTPANAEAAFKAERSNTNTEGKRSNNNNGTTVTAEAVVNTPATAEATVNAERPITNDGLNAAAAMATANTTAEAGASAHECFNPAATATAAAATASKVDARKDTEEINA